MVGRLNSWERCFSPAAQKTQWVMEGPCTEFQNILVFSVSSVCFPDSMHSNWHGLYKFMQNLLTYIISA